MSLVNTLMQPLRAQYAARLDKNELRASQYGAWDFFQKQSALPNSILDPETEKFIKESFGNTVQVPVLDAPNVTISNVRSCTIADQENTSRIIALTFATYSFGFTMVPAQYKNNDVKYQSDFTRKLDAYLLKFASVLDLAAVAKMENDKNIYFPSDLLSFYPQVGNALQVTDEDKNDYYNQLNAIQNVRDYYGSVNVISSTSGMPLVDRLKGQGNANGVNESFQMLGYNWKYTNRITNGAGVKSTQFVVPDGFVGVYNRNDWDAIMGNTVGNGLKVWGQAQMPIVDLNMGTYYYEDCADYSALNAGTTGLTRTKKEGYEWSTDICFVTAYNSDPANRYSPILKTELAGPATA
jgi:hypothetical protein